MCGAGRITAPCAPPLTAGREVSGHSGHMGEGRSWRLGGKGWPLLPRCPCLLFPMLVFIFFFLLFILQIKATICCDKCSHSPFPSYLLPHREALWRLTASSWGWGGVSLSSGLLWLHYFKFWDSCQGKKRPCLHSPSLSFLPTCTACWYFSFVERKSSGWLRSLR